MKAIIFGTQVLGFAPDAVFVGNDIHTSVMTYGGMPANSAQIIDMAQPADFAPGLYTYVNGALVRGPDPAPLVAAAATLKSAQIIDAAQNALAQVVAGYPELEVATWPQQYAESLAYTANPSTAQAPMLTAIASASGQTVAAVASVVMAKASAYQAASGAAVGRRIALLNQVAACTTTAQVQAINW